MAERPSERVALMAIKPVFAEAILSGAKRVEFRKRRLAPDIARVLLYATSPVQRIVGWFEVESTTLGSRDAIWASHGHAGVIDRDAFEQYFTGSQGAVAIGVGAVARFGLPIALSDIALRAVPQSVIYLDLDSALQTRLDWTCRGSRSVSRSPIQATIVSSNAARQGRRLAGRSRSELAQEASVQSEKASEHGRLLVDLDLTTLER